MAACLWIWVFLVSLFISTFKNSEVAEDQMSSKTPHLPGAVSWVLWEPSPLDDKARMGRVSEADDSPMPAPADQAGGRLGSSDLQITSLPFHWRRPADIHSPAPSWGCELSTLRHGEDKGRFRATPMTHSPIRGLPASWALTDPNPSFHKWGNQGRK